MRSTSFPTSSCFKTPASDTIDGSLNEGLVVKKPYQGIHYRVDMTLSISVFVAARSPSNITVLTLAFSPSVI